MADSMWLPPDLQAEQLKMRHKQKLAEAMLGAVQAPQAQIVGGQYVGPGILGQAIPLIKALMGQKLESRALEQNSDFLLKNQDRLGAAGAPKDLYKSGKYTTESINSYEKSGRASDLAQKPKEWDPLSGTTWSTETVELPDGQVLQKGRTRDQTETWRAVPKGISINTGDKMFDATSLKMHQKAAEEAMAARQKAVSNLNLVKKVGEVLPKIAAGETYAGSAADLQTAAASLVQEFFGVKMDGLAATEYIKKLGNEGVAQLIAGATGRSLTDADVQRLATQYASQLNSPGSVKLLISDMERMANQGLAEYNNMREYYRNLGANGDKVGETMYNFMAVPMTGTSILETPLDEEAAKELKPIKEPVPAAGAAKKPVDKLRLPPGVREE